MRAPPSSPSLGQASQAPPSSAHHRASLGHRPSPTPWLEDDPPCPLPLPLLYWPPPPPPLPVTDAHRHQWCRLHFTVARSPSSPSAPIKGTPSAPHLVAPTLPSFPSLTCRSSPPSRAFNRRSISGEGTPDTTASPSPSSKPHGDYRRAVALARRAPVGVPPRSWLHCRSPRWTEPPAWSTGHGSSLPIIQYKNNSVYSKEKPSLQRGPCFCLKLRCSPIKFQTAPLEFKNISRYNPSHFPKSQIGP
jgi:hypothetical protein